MQISTKVLEDARQVGVAADTVVKYQVNPVALVKVEREERPQVTAVGQAPLRLGAGTGAVSKLKRVVGVDREVSRTTQIVSKAETLYRTEVLVIKGLVRTYCRYR